MCERECVCVCVPLSLILSSMRQLPFFHPSFTPLSHTLPFFLSPLSHSLTIDFLCWLGGAWCCNAAAAAAAESSGHKVFLVPSLLDSLHHYHGTSTTVACNDFDSCTSSVQTLFSLFLADFSNSVLISVLMISWKKIKLLRLDASVIMIFFCFYGSKYFNDFWPILTSVRLSTPPPPRPRCATAWFRCHPLYNKKSRPVLKVHLTSVMIVSISFNSMLVCFAGFQIH